jgi:hypothetical protein
VTKEEKETLAKLRREVSDLKITAKQMLAEAAGEATAAHQLGELAKVSKAKAQAASVRVRICLVGGPPSSNSVELIVLNGSLKGQQCCVGYQPLQSTVEDVKSRKASLLRQRRHCRRHNMTAKKHGSGFTQTEVDGGCVSCSLNRLVCACLWATMHMHLHVTDS